MLMGVGQIFAPIITFPLADSIAEYRKNLRTATEEATAAFSATPKFFLKYADIIGGTNMNGMKEIDTEALMESLGLIVTPYGRSLAFAEYREDMPIVKKRSEP